MLLSLLRMGCPARAVQTNAQPLLAEVLPALRTEHLLIGPLVVAHQGRVAIGDAIGSALHADVVVVLIGERPGLSAPDKHGHLSDLAVGNAAHRCRS